MPVVVEVRLMGANEWLLELRSNPGAYQALLKECGSLARAAHRLATAKCSVNEAYKA